MKVESMQGTQAPNAQKHFLGQALPGFTAIEPVGDITDSERIVSDVGVQQV